MIFDYHTHTPLCHHASGTPEEYVQRAVDVGLDEIGFSDHSPMPAEYDPDWRMKESEFAQYREMVERARKAVPGMTVRFGIEADFHPGTEGYVREFLEKNDFDYVIGSIHYLGDWGFDNPESKGRFEEEDVYDVYARYYGQVEGLAASGLFDIWGHPDVVKKFGYRPGRDFEALEQRALDAVAKAELKLEVNSSGLRYPCREIYPSERILRAARERGIGITLGSDAHRPEQVGQDLETVIAILKGIGYRTVYRYKARQSEEVPL